MSHAIRGEEVMGNSRLQVIISKFLEIEPPVFAHMPHLVNDKGTKISKEQPLDTLLSKGFLPESLINGAALLGWNPPHREDASVISGSVSVFMKNEVLGMKDLNDLFSLDKVQKKGALYSFDTLAFFNQQHIRQKFEYFDQLELKRCI